MIYVHIPFCHSKCAYCDFYSTPDLRKVNEVVKRIIFEHERRIVELPENTTYDTIYFGGGTPSILPDEIFIELASILFKPGKTIEFTIEVNPEDVTPEKAELWLKQGVNRVSMGIQSFIDSELIAIGRRHSGGDAEKAFRILRNAGFSNVSCDLIFGLPGQTINSWNESLERLIKLNPEHVSVYCLSYEKGTRLTRYLEDGKITETSEEDLIKMYSLACAFLKNYGYEHYEISNYAKSQYKSLHNSSYWTGKPYLGLGPGAHSLDKNGIRRYNPNNIRKFIESECFPVAEIDKEDYFEKLDDIIICRLRTSAGLDSSIFTPSELMAFHKNATPHIKTGRMTLENGIYKIPEECWLVSDMILRDLLFK